MTTEEVLKQLSGGTTLEGPHWTEPVKVLTAKARGTRIEIQAVGLHTKRLWNKLLKAEEFDGAIRITPAGELATLNGNPTYFRLAAEAHRIRLAFQYDPHFAVSVSQVDPLPHQMDAVYSHLLTQPQIRFLIADDPGAGKTIMAGLTLKELKFRGLVERTLIVTPANLTDQWRRELHEKFTETFTVINRGTVSSIYGRNVWEDNPQCITSIDFVARQDDILNLLRDVRWDLVIVDEAHKMSAYRYGLKVSKTQRYEFGEFMRDRSDHMLFLTATPRKGDPDNFALLLQLLDRDLYVTGDILAEASKHDENRIMIRRLKEDMKKFDGAPCFPPRKVRTLPYKLTPDELALYEAVTDYVQHNFQRAEAAENRNVGLALTVLQRRVASSVAAIRLSLERRLKRLTDLHKLGKIKQEYGELPEDLDDLTEAERWQFEDDLVERLTMAGTMAELENEIQDLERLVKLAKNNERNIPVPKFDALMKDWLANRRSMAEILAEIDLQTDEKQVARIRADMEDRSLGSRYIDLSKLDADRQKSKEQRLMPEYIEKFFVEAYRSFGGTIAPAKDEKGVWSITGVPPDLRKLPESLERRFGKIGQSYAKITFDKEQSQGYSEIEFVGPGHPLFEGVVERVLREYGGSLRQGAVFYNADATDATVLWLLKCAVEDGRGQTIGERLVAVHGRMKSTTDITDGTDAKNPIRVIREICGSPFVFSKSMPYALLDLKSPDRDVEVVPAVRQVATNEDIVIDWSLEAVTPEYFAEINDRRSRELGIKEKYVRKSLQHLISESNKKIAKYDHQLRQLREEADPKRLSVQGNRAQEEARKAELSQRLKDRLEEIEQESHLSEKPPEVVC